MLVVTHFEISGQDRLLRVVGRSRDRGNLVARRGCEQAEIVLRLTRETPVNRQWGGDRKREIDSSFFSRRKWEQRAPIYLPTWCARATTLLHTSTSSSRSRRFRCYRGAGRRDNVTLRGSRRKDLSYSHSCYSPRWPSLAVILEAKYEVHTSCMCISSSLFLTIVISHDIFSSRIKFPREKARYVARLFMSLTSYEFRARALLTSMCVRFVLFSTEFHSYRSIKQSHFSQVKSERIFIVN
jgi:hypothetical protein